MKPLNPIMAALVIASVGASPLWTRASGGTPPAGVAVSTGGDDAVSVLTKKFETPAAREDAGKRVADFLLKPSKGKSFVSEDVSKPELEIVVKAWAKEQPAGSLAMLYFVLGPGDAAPGWVAADERLSKTFPLKTDLEGRLRGALDRFTVAGGAQIVQSMEKPGTTAFLNTAAEEAGKVFNDQRPKPKIDESVDQHDTTAVETPSTRSPATSALTRPYTMKDLYIDGATVMDVSGPKDPHSRTISMKIYTKRLPPPSGQLVQEIGIFDITDAAKGDIFGQFFKIGGGDQTFVLDDRTPGHRKYSLKFEAGKGEGDLKVIFERPGGGKSLTTSVSDLYKKRAAQAAGLVEGGGGKAQTTTINGEVFYVLPQGGAKSSLALFPKDLIDGREGVSPRSLKPALFAEIGERGYEGDEQPIKPGPKGGPHLGTVGGKDYHLVFNNALGLWEVKEGDGDLPAPPAAKKPEAAPSADEGAGPDATDGPAEESEGSLSAGDVIDRIIAKTPGCKAADMSKLASNLKDKYGIASCIDAVVGVKVILILPKSADAPDQQMVYGNTKDQAGHPFKLQGGRLVDHYLVLQFDKQVQYLNLLKPVKQGFDVAGFVSVADKSAVQFTDAGILADALTNYMGVEASNPALAEIPKRLKANMGGKAYSLSASFANGTSLVVSATMGGDDYSIWPTFKKTGEEGGSTAKYADLPGVANAMDAAVPVSSTDEKFPTAILLPESRKALPMEGRVSADFALYESVDEPKKYFAMFKFDALVPKDPANVGGEKEKKTLRQKQFEVFSSSLAPLPENFTQQGLVGTAVVKDRMVMASRFISGTTPEKGVYALFQNKQVSGDNQQNKAANCVGPLIWWGVADREAALKICQDDKF